MKKKKVAEENYLQSYLSIYLSPDDYLKATGIMHLSTPKDWTKTSMVERSCTPNPAPKKNDPQAATMNWMFFFKKSGSHFFLENYPQGCSRVLPMYFHQDKILEYKEAAP